MDARGAARIQYGRRKARNNGSGEPVKLQSQTLERQDTVLIEEHPPDVLPRKKRRLTQSESPSRVATTKPTQKARGTVKATPTSGNQPTRESLSRDSSPLTDLSAAETPPSTPSPTKGASLSREPPPTFERNKRRPAPTIEAFASQIHSSDPISAPSTPGPVSREAFSSPIKPSQRKTFEPESPSKTNLLTKTALNSPSKRIGLTSRMMSRSKTESSLLATSPSPERPERLGPSSSLPVFTAQREKSPSAPRSRNGEGPSSIAPGYDNEANRRAPVHKRTYASTRSYLAPIAMVPQGNSTGVKTEDHAGDHEEETVRESYADLTSRWGLDMEEAVHNEIVLKSISEMRSKGESRRFHDDVGWLMEGLEEDTSVACNSAIDILQKMCDTEFVRRAKAVDYLGRIWGLMMSHRCSGSKVMEVALVFFACLVAKEKSGLNDFVSQVNGAFSFLCDMLSISAENDGLHQVTSSPNTKSKGFSKRDCLSLQRLVQLIRKSDTVSHDGKISLSFLASKALRSFRRNPSSESDRLLSSAVVVLPHGLQSLIESMDSEEGLESLEQNNTLEHLGNCLYLLDISIVSAVGTTNQVKLLDDQDDHWVDLVMKGLVTLCLAASMTNDLELDPRSALRILVNFSTSGTRWTRALEPRLGSIWSLLGIYYHQYGDTSVEDKSQPIEEGSHAVALDRFSLALALITNVVREKPKIREVIQKLKLCSKCESTLSCYPVCHCSPKTRALPFLVTIYNTHSEKLAIQTNLDDAYLTGHLATLLALLCIDCPRSLRTVLDVLPGKSPQDKFDGLARDVESFAASYNEVLNHLAASARAPSPSSAEVGDSKIDLSSGGNFALEVSEQFRAMRGTI